MSYQELFEKLELENAWILTANSRMSRDLIKKYLNFKNKNFNKVILNPQIISFRDFCIKKYEDFKVLSQFEACLIWKKIIIKNTNNYALGLIQPESTAKSIHKAYESLLEADLNLLDLNSENLGDSLNSPETQSFLSWAHEFEKICAEKNWLTEQGFFKKISEQGFSTPLCPSISSSGLSLPQGERRHQNELVLAGFDHVSKRLNKILKSWEKQGQKQGENKNIKISFFKLAPRAKRFKLKVKDKQDEFKKLAELAKKYLAQNLNNKNYKIGIVIPEIVSEREELIEIFLSVLEPEKLRNLHPIPELFAITGGEPLAQVPIIFEGLDLLKNLEVSIKNNLKGVLKKLADWRIYFLKFLKDKKWPGEFILSSYEHQSILKFYQNLENFMGLNFLVGEIDFESALELLINFMGEIFFQPESNKKAQILIYGPLESAGLEHDVLLVANINTGVFPGSTSPNPFVPYSFQRAHDLPHASALRELAYAKARLEDWESLSDLLIVSYRAQEGDLLASPSALIQDFSEWDHGRIQDSPLHPVFSEDDLELKIEYLDDFKAPEVSAEELKNLRSGISIFKSQAACGFQAFAKFRLNIKPIEPPIEPLNLMARGIVTHEILEILMPKIFKLERWRLKNLEDFKDLIYESVSLGLSRLQEKMPEALPGYFRELEFERLVNLMRDWISFEQTRPDFKLLAQEHKIFGSIGGINISGRIDRIDELENKLLIIDYKTGRVSALNWLGERPDDPQLPIYSVLLDHSSGISYAKIDPREMGLESFEDLSFEDLNFEDQKKSWLEVFEKLAREYLNGEANLNPKYGDLTCSRCDYLRLCRRHEV